MGKNENFNTDKDKIMPPFVYIESPVKRVGRKTLSAVEKLNVGRIVQLTTATTDDKQTTGPARLLSLLASKTLNAKCQSFKPKHFHSIGDVKH